MKKWKLLLFVSVAFQIGAIRVFADPCDVTLTVSNVDLSWNLDFTPQPVTITVTKISDSACDYGIGFSRGGASTYTRRMVNGGGVPLYYQLYKEVGLTHILKYGGEITSADDVYTGHFDAGVTAPQQFTYYVQIPLALATAPAFKPWGNYSDTFNISAYEGVDPVQFSTAITTQPVVLTVTIPKIVQLSVGNSGASFDPAVVTNTVAFGSLFTGLVAQRDLLIRTNAGYSVTFSSENLGAMVHSNPAIATTVPYSFEMNAETVDLSQAPSTAVNIPGQTSIEGNRNPILIRVGNIQSGMAGTYSDTISISVNSLD